MTQGTPPQPMSTLEKLGVDTKNEPDPRENLLDWTRWFRGVFPCGLIQARDIGRQRQKEWDWLDEMTGWTDLATTTEERHAEQ